MCVPQSQQADYAKVVGSDRILTHPDLVKGLTAKLNWIFDFFEHEKINSAGMSVGLMRRLAQSDTDALVFIDDDIASLQRCFVGKGEEATIRDPQLIEEIITNTARLAGDVGAFYFGWEASNGAVLFYTGLKPFSLTGYINGCAMGFRRGHGLRFDERIVAKNDFDIAAMNALKHRLCFKDCRYSFCQKETFTGLGGQAAFRTSATEKRDVALLQKKWGDIFGFGGYSATRKRDYAGVQKITMHLPF